MTDSKALKTRIAECGLKMTYIADKMGITYACFNGKVNNKYDFKAQEIAKIASILGLNQEDVFAIFFLP